MESIWVLIVSDSLTFSDGLKSLLLLEPQVEIIEQEMDVSRVINHLNKLKPDVIIWADTGLRWNAVWDEIRLLALAATIDIKTVSLNLRNNEIAIYQSGRKTIRTVEGVQDLIETVEEDFPSKHPAHQVDYLTDWLVASGQPV
jgi:DNA-binding NarL/FixJ family response regulator